MNKDERERVDRAKALILELLKTSESLTSIEEFTGIRRQTLASWYRGSAIPSYGKLEKLEVMKMEMSNSRQSS